MVIKMGRINQSLSWLAKELYKNDFDYFITGGAALAILGIIKETKDIDVFLYKKDFPRLKKLTNNKVLPSVKGENYLELKFRGCKVEFIGVSQTYDRKSYLALKNKDYDKITICRQMVNVSTLENLLECYRFAYKKFGKRKHLLRMRLIESKLSKK